MILNSSETNGPLSNGRIPLMYSLDVYIKSFGTPPVYGPGYTGCSVYGTSLCPIHATLLPATIVASCMAGDNNVKLRRQPYQCSKPEGPEDRNSTNAEQLEKIGFQPFAWTTIAKWTYDTAQSFNASLPGSPFKTSVPCFRP